MNETIAAYITNLTTVLNKLDQLEIIKISELLLEARDNKKQIFIFGNGGSASTASHFACDINKGVSKVGTPRFKVICLNDNIPTMLAYSNDINYDCIFAEQLQNFVNEGDLVIAISGSGNSKNVIKAIEVAKEHKAITIGITGYSGGKLKTLADYSLNANIDDMQISEDIHMIWVHLMMKCLLK
ncbi:MAG: SIS domain-containing protein [Flavobacterium sp.]|nr:SIS domain-containing protein [Flavobacterium sp.]